MINVGDGTMSKMIDKLSIEKKIIACRVIDRLVSNNPRAVEFNQQLNDLNTLLSLAKTKDEFFIVVQQIIEKEKEVHAFLQPIIAHVEPEILESVNEYMSNHANMVAITHLLNFNAILGDSIISTKEKLSNAALESALSEEQHALAKAFINQVKELGPIAAVIQEEKLAWVQRLNDTDAMDQIDSIDDEIEAQGKIISSVYAHMVSFPEDDQTCGVLIDYLDENPQLKTIMQTFDFYESLVNDILAARMEQHHRSGPNGP